MQYKQTASARYAKNEQGRRTEGQHQLDNSDGCTLRDGRATQAKAAGLYTHTQYSIEQRHRQRQVQLNYPAEQCK